jgi:hypothetical protein
MILGHKLSATFERWRRAVASFRQGVVRPIARALDAWMRAKHSLTIAARAAYHEVTRLEHLVEALRAENREILAALVRQQLKYADTFFGPSVSLSVPSRRPSLAGSRDT